MAVHACRVPAPTTSQKRCECAHATSQFWHVVGSTGTPFGSPDTSHGHVVEQDCLVAQQLCPGTATRWQGHACLYSCCGGPLHGGAEHLSEHLPWLNAAMLWCGHACLCPVVSQEFHVALEEGLLLSQYWHAHGCKGTAPCTSCLSDARLGAGGTGILDTCLHA